MQRPGKIANIKIRQKSKKRSNYNIIFIYLTYFLYFFGKTDFSLKECVKPLHYILLFFQKNCFICYNESL